MASEAIERADVELETSPISGRPDAIVGAIRTDDATVGVGVGGNPTVVDISVEERVPDGEGLGDALQNIASRRRTYATVGLDDEAAKGLVRLLNQAIALRNQAANPESRCDAAAPRAA